MAMWDDVFDDRRTRTRQRPDPIGTTFTPSASPMAGSPFVYRGPAAAPPAASADPFSMFDDPSTRLLTDTIKKQMALYAQPTSMDPDTAGVLDMLKGIVAGGPGGSSGNALLGDFIAQGRQRISELNQEPFSPQEEAALKTKAQDQLTRDRDQAYQNAREDIARRGMADSSGLLDERMKAIDSGYQQGNAKALNDLMLFIAGERQNRKNQATTIAQQLAGAGAQEEQIANASREAGYGRILQAASAIANIAAQQRGEARANQQQVLNLAAMMAQLPVDRLNMMLGIVNGTGGGPAGMSSLFNNTLALSNQQINNQRYADEGRASQLEGLSQLFSYFANRGRTS